jgi:2-polyprenyl-3-methyl-5-hydroxy-6-metoxy-1,4-benzoquinol methylase
MKNNNCPSCNSDNIFQKIEYPGNFLNIKHLLSCNDCSLVFAKDMPSEAEIRSFYSNEEYYGDKFDPFSKQFYLFSESLAISRIDFIKIHLPNLFQSDPSILDVGTGNGVFLKLLSNMGISKIDCIEPDINMFQKGGNSIRNHFLSLDAIKGETYDLITLNQVLEHVADPKTFIKDLEKHLNPKGAIYIDLPHEDYKFKDDVSSHLTFWNTKALKKFIISNNFSCLYLNTAGMTYNQAKVFFNTARFNKFFNPYYYKKILYRILTKLKIYDPQKNNFFSFFMNSYGGNRIWIRALVKKN